MTSWLNSFRIRLMVFFGGLSLVAGLAVILHINQLASQRITDASGESLTGLARSMASFLAETLTEREREIALVSQRPTFVQGRLDHPVVRDSLEKIKQSYRHYSWIGVAAPDGRVLTATGGLLEGESVSQRPWFQRGLSGNYVGDVHEAVLLTKKLPPNETGEPLRFVDFAAPIFTPEGQLRGVVATHANWTWVDEVIRKSLPGDAGRNGIEVFIVSQQGDILHPFESIGKTTLPATLPADNAHVVTDWGGSDRYLTTLAEVHSTTATRLGWRVVLRQPIAVALAPVVEMQRKLLLFGGAATLLFIVMAYWLARAFSRPIEMLAKAADQVRQGNEDTRFITVSSLREIRTLAESLQSMTQTLVRRKQELQDSNATLELKVRERTSALEKANQELDALARRDALSGLQNRLSANEQLHGEFLRMKRTGNRYALMLLDIDHFKRVNDTHGHETGDAVIRHVAAVLKSTARATDFVARFGGEEFLIILPDTETEGAAIVAEKIRTAIATTTPPVVQHLTVSIGVIAASSDDASEESALRAADAALYQAKAAGRNRVVMAGHE